MTLAWTRRRGRGVTTPRKAASVDGSYAEVLAR